MPPEANVERADQSQEPRKSRKWILILGVLLLLVMGLGLGFYLGGAFSEPSGPPPEPPREVSEVLDLEPFVVNLQNGLTTHYARVAISLGIFNPVPGEQVVDPARHIPKFRDRLISILGTKSADQLLQPESKEQLKQEILKQLNQVLDSEKGEVLEVYFTEFLIQ